MTELASSSCPTTGEFCKYLETLDEFQEQAIFLDAEAVKQTDDILARNLGDVAAKFRPSRDSSDCRDGFCTVVNQALREVVIVSAVRKTNDEILGIGQPLFKRKKKS